MKIKLANYVSKFFVDNGVKDCFMVTGGGAMHLNDAFGNQKNLNCTFNHHEQACAIAAESYARITGDIAVVCVTSGPGGTNAITGVMGGYLDSIPMFIISGQVKRETTIYSCPDINIRQLGDQEFDIVNSVSNMTKYAVIIMEPLDIAYHLEKALYLAKDGRKGPVWIDIPLDVQGAMIETDELKHFYPEKENFWNEKYVSYDKINEIVSRIKEAKSPLILAGSGITSSNSRRKFLKLVEKFKIPVVTAWNCGDLLSFDSEYFVGVPGTVGTRSGNFAIQNCDLLLSLSCRMNIRMIGYNKYDFAKNAYKIVVDIDKNELMKPTIKVDLPIHTDVSDFIDRMIDSNYKSNSNHKKWLKWCKNNLKKYPVVQESYHRDDKFINPYVFIDKLFDNLESDDRIICGNGSACVITFQVAKIKQGQRMFTNSGCASMGYGLPAALGVAVSNNDKRTICIDGDGSIMMNLQELSTISYNKLNIKIFLINNNGYHSIRQTQRNLFKGNFIGIDNKTGVGFYDFCKIADAFNIKYFKIESEKDSEIINSTLKSSGPCLCEVFVDGNQNFAPKSSSKVLPNGNIVSPSLDDMFPFLDREEYESNRYINI
ncbi:hypothetical protein HMPREF9628_01102 [Peptoanaerobacter stomatis]|uniref:Thiamine pyrophosphate enzyme, N-terminal TPP binding domain protein n=1 Tax=Peptoanaerobacter stomatis TaxID=796937 RepID=G9XAT5_9FIRM|nr:thiamine pyrophosphate-binding protein [Peptoanaerobacter stomatis]EHL19929.1 hypothetical protein HMPREF9628_01102 [Peptoanaerobacter stomatis]